MAEEFPDRLLAGGDSKPLVAAALESIPERLFTGHLTTQDLAGGLFYQQTKEVALDAAGARIPTRMDVSPALMSMTIQGARDNTGPVYIGHFSVGGNGSVNVGFALQPGVDFGPVRCSRANQIYFNADNDGDRLVIIGVM